MLLCLTVYQLYRCGYIGWRDSAMAKRKKETQNMVHKTLHRKHMANLVFNE
jgi:hypothetical protein